MISFVESGERKPTLDTLLRIASVFEIDVEKLIAKARKDARDQLRKAE
jgi:transcriptional regulator with XRE-family HTH domain